MIKAIFFDIDGTLISFNTHTVPDSTIEAIRKAREKGILVFAATGRQLSAINGLDGIVLDGYITLNGAYCADKRKRTIFKQSIPSSSIDSIVSYFENVRSLPCVFVEEDRMCVNEVDDRVLYLYKLLRSKGLPVMNVDYFRQREIFQLTAFVTEEETPEFMRHLPGCADMRWHPDFTDIIASGIDKSVGIDKICAHYGLSLSDTMAFGDGGNDIPMIGHAGIGVAMGNASDRIKQSADFVTDSVDDDGVMRALIHYGVISAL